MYIYPAEMGTALVWNHICRETERERYIYIRVCVCLCRCKLTLVHIRDIAFWYIDMNTWP